MCIYCIAGMHLCFTDYAKNLFPHDVAHIFSWIILFIDTHVLTQSFPQLSIMQVPFSYSTLRALCTNLTTNGVLTIKNQCIRFMSCLALRQIILMVFKLSVLNSLTMYQILRRVKTLPVYINRSQPVIQF